MDHCTTFKSSESPPGSRLDYSESYSSHYDRLGTLNTLDWNGKWRDESSVTEKSLIGVRDSITSALDMTDYQKQRTAYLIDQLKDDFIQPYSTSLFVFTVAMHVGRKDGRNWHPNVIHPQKDEYDSDFGKLANELGIKYNKLYSCWTSVMDNL